MRRGCGASRLRLSEETKTNDAAAVRELAQVRLPTGATILLAAASILLSIFVLSCAWEFGGEHFVCRLLDVPYDATRVFGAGKEKDFGETGREPAKGSGRKSQQN